METTNPLMHRIIRFINFNSVQYIEHRSHGDYRRAVQRLHRLGRLVAVADQAAREGKSELSPEDAMTIRMARRHVQRMLAADNILDISERDDQYADTPT